jgi:hypothetical protein
MFLLTPYSLIGACNNVQNCTSVHQQRLVRGEGELIYVLFWGGYREVKCLDTERDRLHNHFS